MSHDLFSFALSSLPSLSTADRVAPAALLVREESGDYRPAQANEVLQAAQCMLLERMRCGLALTSPQAMRNFLAARLGALEYEVFAVLHLDARLGVIDYAEMFRGTVTQTSVYPREVVKEAMARNSCSVVLVHNHPSGNATPSRADEALTRTLKAALTLVDVQVLDHLIVAGAQVVSMAEMGLM